MTTQEFAIRIESVLQEVETMLLEKNAAYGDAALSPIRIFSKSDSDEQIRVRLDDKLSRIKNGSDNEDTILDLMGYLVLLRIKQQDAV